MQEPYPRAQSAMQTRNSSFQNKASKIFQKVSNLKGRLRLWSGSNTRKVDDEGHLVGVGPYMNMNATRQTRSMDLNMQVAKPYMSQPILTIPSMLGPEMDNDRRDSYSSQSPDHSPTTFTFPSRIQLQSSGTTEGRTSIEGTPQQLHSHSHSIPAALIPGIHTAVVVGGRGVNMDGLPSNSMDRVPAGLFVNELPSSSGNTDNPAAELNRRYQSRLEMEFPPQITVSPSSVPPSPSVSVGGEGGSGNVNGERVKGVDSQGQGQRSTRTSVASSKESLRQVVRKPSSSSMNSQKKAGTVSHSTSVELERDNYSAAATMKRPTTSGSSTSTSTITTSNSRRDKDLPEIPSPQLPPPASSTSLPASSASQPSLSHMVTSNISPPASAASLYQKSNESLSSHSNIPSQALPLKTSNFSNSASSVVPQIQTTPSKSSGSGTSAMVSSLSQTTTPPKASSNLGTAGAETTSSPNTGTPPSAKAASSSNTGTPPSAKATSSSTFSSPPSSFHLPSRFQQPPKIPHSTTAPSPISLARRPSTSPSSPPMSNSASLPSRRPSVPQLTTILPGNRFSLAMSEGENASARLSPSIIIRQPAFPILHLPSLNGVGSPVNASRSHGLAVSEGGVSPISPRRDGGAGMDVLHARMESRRKLRHMPALPMAGNDKREEDDGNDTEDGEDDDDDDDDMSMEMEGEDDDEDDHGRQSSLESGARSLEITRQALPMVDVSRIDLSFLDQPPSSPVYDAKGKGRTQAPTQAHYDPKMTPTSTSVRTPREASSNDYFSMTSVHGSDSFATAGPSKSVHPQTPGTSARTPRAVDIPAPIPLRPHVSHITMAMPMTPPLPVPGKPGLYKHASRSMLDIPGFGLHVDRKKEKEDEVEVDDDEEIKEEDVGVVLDGVLDHADGISKKAHERERKLEVEVPSVLVKPKLSSSHLPARSDALAIMEEPREPRIGSGRGEVLPATAPPHASQEHPHPQIQTPVPLRPPTGSGSARPPSAAGSLLRRRSMPTFNASSPPPPYPTFLYPHYYHISDVVQSAPTPPPPPPPPLEEDNEALPQYSNSIYLRAIMPRKMEFSKPGVQARDRKWRRVVCELEGTVFRVYRCPPALAGTGKVVDWWERKVGVGDVSIGNGIGGMGVDSATVGINTSASGVNAVSAEEREREQERLRAEKLTGESGEGVVGQQTHTDIHLPQPKSATQANMTSSRDQGSTSVGDTLQPPPLPTRSRLVNLLKHSKPHNRSQSDVPNPPKVTSATRSSFNLPRPSFGNSSSSSMSMSLSGSADDSTSTTTSTAATSNQSLSVSIPSSASSLGPNSASRSSTRGGMRTPATNTSNSGVLPPGVTCPEPDKNDIIKAYTLQNAESGLGNDYFKRKNVIRVRMEGEQFLLQARDVSDVVEWIEGLQSATNVALDLDERPMPRGPLFPRRRRRRPRRTPENEGGDSRQEGAESSTARAAVS